MDEKEQEGSSGESEIYRPIAGDAANLTGASGQMGESNGEGGKAL